MAPRKSATPAQIARDATRSARATIERQRKRVAELASDLAHQADEIAGLRAERHQLRLARERDQRHAKQLDIELKRVTAQRDEAVIALQAVSDLARHSGDRNRESKLRAEVDMTPLLQQRGIVNGEELPNWVVSDEEAARRETALVRELEAREERR